MMTPVPGVTPAKPGSCAKPLPGIFADIVDDEGRPVKTPDGGGYLVIKRPWPSMLRTIWGDNERYLKTYWEKFQNRYYVAGDSARRDKDGYYWIMGRIDDVLNVAGHRLGTMEIESALVAHPKVAEAAVVGKPHDIKGESVFAYVVLNVARPAGPAETALHRGTARLGGRATEPHRQARRNPPHRQSAEDAVRENHAPPAALDRARRGNHPGHVDPGESGNSRAAARGACEARQAEKGRKASSAEIGAAS